MLTSSVDFPSMTKNVMRRKYEAIQGPEAKQESHTPKLVKISNMDRPFRKPLIG